MRKEEERIAALPPPPVVAKRWDIRYKGPKSNKGLTLNSRGTAITSKTKEPCLIVSSECCTNDPYVLEDFPEDADDIPGTFDPYIPPPLPTVEEEKEESIIVAEEPVEEEKEPTPTEIEEKRIEEEIIDKKK